MSILTSDVWNFFEPVSNTGYATCKICKKKLSYKTTTSNLRKHISAVHPTISLARRQRTHQFVTNPDDPETLQPGPSLAPSLPPSMPSISQDNPGQTVNSETILLQPRITSFLQRRITPANSRNIDQKLLKLFIKDLQPFSIVDDAGFKEFVQALNPNYVFPDRKFISHSLIPALYEECKNSCKERLRNAVTICVTTDSWTSRNTESFIAITAHFINNFKLESILLDCTKMSITHTSENISTTLKKICYEWEIFNIINSAVTDNAPNIKNAITDYCMWQHIPCFAHTLNLIIKYSLNVNTITSLLENVRTIVRYFKKSTTATEKLQTYQITSGRSPQKLISDVATRWNSTYYMIDRFVLLEEPVRATVAIIDKNLPYISNPQWEILHELAVILKPIESVTKIVSGEKYPTASIIIPLISGLREICVKLKQKAFSESSQQVIYEIEHGLARFQNIENNLTVQICTFLDPRFKHAFFSQNTLNLIKIEILQKLTDNAPPETQNQTNTEIAEPDELSIWNIIDENIKRNNPEVLTEENKVTIEIEEYLRKEFYDKNGNPLLWWSEHQYQFPLLLKLVQQLLCIVASSVPCERIFSKAGLILTDRRNRLKATKLSMLLFLNNNL